MIPINLKSLQKFLLEKNNVFQIQEETQQLYRVLHIHGREFPLFIRIFESSDLLQLLVFMPCKIRANTHSDLARLLHYINKELDVPGFGMDENTEVVFYRCMLPTPRKEIDPNLLETFLNSCQLICDSLSPAVIAVAMGQATFVEILNQVQKGNK